MRKNKVILSFLVFSIVAIAQIGIDLVFSFYLSEAVLADWAYFKSFFLLAMMFSLLGLNQSIVRVDVSIKEIIYPVLIQFSVFSLVFASLSSFGLGIKANFFSVFLIVFLLSVIQFFYGYFQGKKELVKSQIMFGSWRFLFFSFSLAGFYLNKDAIQGFVLQNLVDYLSLSLFISISFLFLFLGFNRFLAFVSDIRKKGNFLVLYKKYKEFYGTSLIFFSFAVTFNISTYFDQLFLGFMNSKQELAIYFVHLTVMLTPIMFLNKFIGFIAFPYSKKFKDKNISLQQFRQKISLFLLAGIVLAILDFYLSPYIFHMLYKGKYVFNASIGLGIVIIGVLRLIYIIPSSMIGMLASQKQLLSFLLVNVIGIVAQFFVLGLGYYLGEPIIFVVILSVIANWSIRTSLGVVQVFKLKEVGINS